MNVLTPIHMPTRFDEVYEVYEVLMDQLRACDSLDVWLVSVISLSTVTKQTFLHHRSNQAGKWHLRVLQVR